MVKQPNRHRGSPIRMGAGFQRLAPAEHAVSVEVVVNLIRATRLVLDVVEPVLRGHGLSAPTFAVLDVLVNSEQPVSPTQIAARMLTPAQTLTHLLDTLQRRGLLRRVAHPTDRRSVLVELTPAGREAVMTAARAVIPVEVALLDPISPTSQHRLVTLLGQLQRAAHTASRPEHGTADGAAD